MIPTSHGFESEIPQTNTMMQDPCYYLILFYTNHGYTVEISQITDVISNVAVIHESMDEREKN